MHRRLLALLVTASIAAWAAALTAEPATPHGTASFESSQSFTETTLNEGSRKGWTERRWALRFGSYALSVVQRIDPETGFPPRRRTWGDSFIGIAGKKPAFYMASNWSPWNVLTATIRLEGDKAPLPSPTLYGRCTFAGLRLADDDRIVAEAVFRDTAGGDLRLRLVGLRRHVDRFGVMVRYDPPEGRTVQSIRYELVCQPYDYSDRGYWQRRRWLTAPGYDTELAQKKPVTIDLARTRRLVLHNRHAQNDAGTFVLLPGEGSKAASVETRGSTVEVRLTPRRVDGWTTAVLGDWVYRSYAEVAREFFAEAKLDEQLAAFAVKTIAPPSPIADWQHRSVDALLAKHDVLKKAFAEAVAARRTAEKDLLETMVELSGKGQPVPAALLSQHADARRELSALYRSIRGAWVERKLWR